jgi:general secretion pathway protein E
MTSQFQTYDFSKHSRIIVKNSQTSILEIAADKSADLKTIEKISWNFKKPYNVNWYNTDQFDVLLNEVFINDDTTAESIQNIGEEIEISSFINEIDNSDDILKSHDDAPIIKLLNLVLKEAISRKASDIHLQVFEDKLNIKLRIHGSIENAFTLKAGIAARLFTRIKIISGLDITEKRKPQDGRVTINIGSHPIDLRISTIPSYDNERIVLRLLDQRHVELDLNSLGMLSNQLDEFTSLLEQKSGIILVTGPTGSGKTTTLYAAIERIKKKNINIMTIEDPIEYKIEGISQTQVNPKINLSFADGLRSILRQDPDVILVGEIRDEETADIALRASLTGHLVLSTLHTNSPLGAFDRLNELGVDKKMLTSSVLCVIGQSLEKNFNQDGRTAIFETIPMSEGLQDALSQSTEEHFLRKNLPETHLTLTKALAIKKENKDIS